MSRITKLVLIVAAIAVSAWLIAGPPIPPFQTFTTVSYDVAYAAKPDGEGDAVASRTAFREYLEGGMLNHTRPWHEQHEIKYKSGRAETVSVASGVDFNRGPLTITLAFLLAIWAGVVIACRRPSIPETTVSDVSPFSLKPHRRSTQPVPS